jgi:hypothetical protein
VKGLLGWVRELEQNLAELENAYLQSEDAEHRQASAVVAYITLVDSVRKLPGNFNLRCLSDLAHALHEVTEGRKPALLNPPATGRGARRQSAREESEADKAITLTEVLLRAGWQEKDATAIIAKWMAEAGFVGARGRRAVTQSTVRYWRAVSRNGDDPERRQCLDTQVDGICNDLAQFLRSLAPADDDARSIVEAVVRSAIGKPAGPF